MLELGTGVKANSHEGRALMPTKPNLLGTRLGNISSLEACT
jgi:hypothetical protein